MKKHKKIIVVCTIITITIANIILFISQDRYYLFDKSDMNNFYLFLALINILILLLSDFIKYMIDENIKDKEKREILLLAFNSLMLNHKKEKEKLQQEIKDLKKELKHKNNTKK